jgi:hypothetical protein
MLESLEIIFARTFSFSSSIEKIFTALTVSKFSSLIDDTIYGIIVCKD